MTLHPEGKEGVNIDAEKYQQIKGSIFEILERDKSLTFSELSLAVKELLSESFKGSVPWYVTTVKLDLEARGLIHCQRGKGPQRISLAL